VSDATLQAIIVAFFTSLPPTLVAYGALRNSKKAVLQGQDNGAKIEAAAGNAETAAAKADVAAVKANEAHSETKIIKAEAQIIKSQTDGQFDKMRAEIKQLHQELMDVYRENAALRSILSAREKKPAGEAVRSDDAISSETGTLKKTVANQKQRRRASDPKADDPA